MRSNSGLVGPTLSGGRAEAYDAATVRTGGGLLIALALHSAFLLYAYLRPLPDGKKKSRPIEMLIVEKKKETPPPPPPQTPEPPPPTPPAALTPPTRTVSRPLPKELAPVARKDDTPDAKSPAIAVGPQPPGPPEGPSPGLPKGPIDLFPKNLGTIVGAPSANAPIPKGPDRLFKDERLEEKKEPKFELVPDKGGGYKCETKTFVAHIKPDGKIEFENRFPIGFEKGGTFSFDLTDLVMRGKKIDPYAAEKRRFLEFSDKLRNDLRKKAAAEAQTNAMSTFAEQLISVWENGRSGASRRRELYEKWADCSDDKNDSLGRKGRHAVEDFIRGHLPRGSSNAYTDEELQKIASERQGMPPFDPYGTGTP